MRLLSFCLLLLPIYTFSQVSRSATELTHENIYHYINHKIFPNKTYTPVFFSQLEVASDRNDYKITWKMDHRFQIAEKKIAEPKNYRFVFFLGKRMNIIKAEAAYIE
jgi:hypothetical protein